MSDNRIEVLVGGWWESEEIYGEVRVGDLYRTTKVPSHVTRITNIQPDGDGGMTIEGTPAGRSKEPSTSSPVPR